ncbi:hypothetical protein D3C75_1066310 [compost metagenome]
MRGQVKARVSSSRQRSILLRQLTGMNVLEDIRSGQFRWWTEEQIGEWISRNQEEI